MNLSLVVHHKEMIKNTLFGCMLRSWSRKVTDFNSTKYSNASNVLIAFLEHFSTKTPLEERYELDNDGMIKCTLKLWYEENSGFEESFEKAKNAASLNWLERMYKHLDLGNSAFDQLKKKMEQLGDCNNFQNTIVECVMCSRPLMIGSYCEHLIRCKSQMISRWRLETMIKCVICKKEISVDTINNHMNDCFLTNFATYDNKPNYSKRQNDEEDNFEKTKRPKFDMSCPGCFVNIQEYPSVALECGHILCQDCTIITREDIREQTKKTKMVTCKECSKESSMDRCIKLTFKKSIMEEEVSDETSSDIFSISPKN